MNPFLSILSDAAGGLSSTRLAFVLWACGVLFVWGYRSVTGDSLAEIPESVLTVLGILMGGKVVQRFGEKKACEPLRNPE